MIPRFAFCAIAAMCAAMASGCSHVTALSRDCDAAPGRWCEPAVRVAQSSFEYAQLAHNAYWERALETDSHVYRLFVLNPDFQERFASANDARGFAYTVFDRHEGDRIVETILAFRGTEGPVDWWHGNLLGRQSERGLWVYRQLRRGMDRAGYDAVPITITGHSLGGDVADYVVRQLKAAGSPRIPAAYTFNMASRRRLATDPETPSAQIAIAESGEIGGLLRSWHNRRWSGYVVDCRPGIDPINDHYMRYLAECLTWIAASGDARAARSIRDNAIEPPPAEQADMTPSPATDGR